MSTPGFTDAALGAGSKVGRHFGVVSTIPSALLVLFGYGLVASRAWTGPPDLAALEDAVSDFDLGTASLLLLTTLAVGLAMHPLQFAATQVLEGYWGPTRIARRLAARRITHHLDRVWKLDDGIGSIGEQDTRGLTDANVRAIVALSAFRRARNRYPASESDVLPTRLGNVLRRFERSAGRQYGLDIVTVAPHLALLAPPEHTGYLDDARTQLDLAVRLCVVSTIATLAALAFLASDGAWLLVALAPYGLTYLSYRGAIASAEEYGTALATIADLDRFALYDALRLPQPIDTATERAQNVAAMRLLRFRPTSVAYAHPPEAHPPGGAPRRLRDRLLRRDA